MGIRHYYNTIKKGTGNSRAAKKAYSSYCSEISEKVHAGTRFVYAGNLDSPGIKQLVKKFLEDKCNSSEQIVLGIENALNPRAEEFLSELPSNVDYVIMPQGNGADLSQAAMLYMYSNMGIKSRALEELYRKLADRYFNLLSCENVELLSSEKVEIIEAIIACNKRSVWHRIPLCFYDRLSGMLYARPEILCSWARRFDSTIAYECRYGIEIWEENRCHGIYAKLKGLSFDSGEENTGLSGRLTVRSESVGARPKNEVILGSRVYEDEFRYPAELTLRSSKQKLGISTEKYSLAASFPNSEMKNWFSTNLLYIPVDMLGEELTVPVLVDKSLNPFRRKLYDIRNTDYVCEVKDIYRHYRFVIRKRLVTDAGVEKAKLAAAYFGHLLTPWYKPVVMYEKLCRGYEESASVLFEKLIDRKNRNVRYILNREIKDELELPNKYKKRIVEQFSFRHYYNLFACRSILSSEAIGHALEKGSNNWLFRNAIVDGHKDYVFLQHGVMYMVSLSAEQRSFFNKRSGRGQQKVVVSSQLEAEHFTDNTDYRPEDMYISGLPKFDRSVLNADADRIAVMLTWRPWEEVTGMTDIRQTAYYGMLREIVRNVPDELKSKLIVMPHPLVLEQVKQDPEDEVWRYYVPGLKYEEMLRQSSLLITDYSSISYDAFYRGANIIFCWAEKDECMSNYGENAHLMLTEELAFGEICYRNEDVTEAVKRAYAQPQQQRYIDNYSKIVEFHDGNNAERLTEMIEKDGILSGKAGSGDAASGSKGRSGSGGAAAGSKSVLGGKLGRIVARFGRRLKREYKKLKNRGADRALEEAREQYPLMLEAPINENGILLEARNGKEADGNVYYMLKELLSADVYKDYEIYLSVLNDKVLADARAKLEACGCDAGRINPVYVDSLEYFYAYATCRYLINDSSIKNFFVKREEQLYLNLWHGTPFKHMGKKVAHEPHAIGNVQKNFVVADYLLYPNEYMMEHMLEDYMIENISHAKLLISGYPRNIAFFDTESREEIIRALKLEGKRIYVYMPTWRPEQMGFRMADCLAEFDKALGADELMFAKLHPLAGDKLDYSKFKHIRKFPASYETYEFLNIADCLITDYSSVFYDYAVSGRKIVLFTYDEEEYFRTRGVYEPIETLPFPRTATVAATMAEARAEKNYDDRAFLNRFCSMESPEAAKLLCRRFILGETSMEIDEREMPQDGRPIVIVRAGALAADDRTARAMNFLREADTEEKNYYLSFDRGEIKNNRDILFELPDGINYYGKAGKPLLTAEQKQAKRDYKKGRISEEEYKKHSEAIRLLEKRRVFGDINISEIIDIR